MSLEVDCPSGHPLKVPRKRAGHVVRCPVCDQRVQVPRLPEQGTSTPEAERGVTAEAPAVLQEAGPAPENRSENRSARSPLDVRIDTSASPSRDKLRKAIEQAGSRRNRERKGTLWVLSAASLGVVALVATPAAVVFQSIGGEIAALSDDTWTFLTLLAALIQAAVAVYALRLPDWSTSWVASLVTTAVAAAYASGLALTMFADQENRLVRQLGLLDEMFRGTVQPWCFLVVCLTLILAYAYARFSMRWYREAEGAKG